MWEPAQNDREPAVDLKDSSSTAKELEPPPDTDSTTWRGLVIAPEYRCSPYSRSDYRYSQRLEDQIVARLGGRIYSPYTRRSFASTKETDIEHMVATSEAHDSGLCAATDAARRIFASDLDNLTLASPSVNRHQKSDKDAADWLPQHNQCWFAAQVVKVRQKYGLTIDWREKQTLKQVLSRCPDGDV